MFIDKDILMKCAMFSIAAPLARKIVSPQMLAKYPFKIHGAVSGADMGIKAGALLGLLNGLRDNEDGLNPIEGTLKGMASGALLGGLGGGAFGHKISGLNL